MAVIRNLLNDGLAEVDDELAKTLVEAGTWVKADAPVRKRRVVKAVEEPTEG